MAKLAGRQFGRVSSVQLRALDIPRSTIQYWVATAYLHPVLPRVYAVGHLAKTAESELMGAVLYAGPGAVLSHATAAWWVGLVDSRPYMIDVSTPRRCRSVPRIRIHARRLIAREWHRGLPVTPFTQTMIDYSARASLSKVRLALARADFQGGLNTPAIEAELGRGRPGASRLRKALISHQPELARTKSDLEVAFFELCEAAGLPLPELNGRIAGWEVDALWRAERLAVELDGPGNHRTPAAVRRDRRKEFDLRTVGLTVLRYSDDQVAHEPAPVLAEVRCALSPPGLSA